jgi:hypothetical protein
MKTKRQNLKPMSDRDLARFVRQLKRQLVEIGGCGCGDLASSAVRTRAKLWKCFATGVLLGLRADRPIQARCGK